VWVGRLPCGCTGQNGPRVMVCQVEIFGLGRGRGWSLVGRFRSWARSIGFVRVVIWYPLCALSRGASRVRVCLLGYGLVQEASDVSLPDIFASLSAALKKSLATHLAAHTR
jgi:hypothetical protein